MPQGLTVLAPIRRGEETALRDVLRAIGDDIRGTRTGTGSARPHIDFPRSRSIHFARFAILRDPQHGADASRLLFSSNYDGALDAHLSELVALTSDMNAIWGRCEGYGGVDGFPAFVRAHAHEPEAFYIAFRDETVQTIRHAAWLSGHVRDLIDSAATGRLEELRADGALQRLRAAGARVADALRRVRRAAPIAADVGRAVSRHGVGTVLRSTLRIVASLDRYPLFRVANWMTRNGMPPRQSLFSSVTLDGCAAFRPLAPGDEIPSVFPTAPTFREDVVTQNQLTLVTVVRPGQVDRVRAVMSAIDSYAKRLAPAGSLIGITTIHFVRWLIVDGNRLIMLSDYDGSWENYIDEFAEMILSGLDAIWETSSGFPPDGARDLPAFKRFLRSPQVPAEVFFSAYPDQTVLNVSRNLRLARAIYDGREPLAELLPTV